MRGFRASDAPGRTPRTPGGALSARQRGCESSLQFGVDLAWGAAQLECIAGRRSEPPAPRPTSHPGPWGLQAANRKAKRSALGADRGRGIYVRNFRGSP
eukprot:3704442-Alexandrium_andersonii.AAC.1